MGQMQAINDEFKELQDSLQLCSIYETAHTELGEESALVLEKVNGVLGTPIFRLPPSCDQVLKEAKALHRRRASLLLPTTQMLVNSKIRTKQLIGIYVKR